MLERMLVFGYWWKIFATYNVTTNVTFYLAMSWSELNILMAGLNPLNTI